MKTIKLNLLRFSQLTFLVLACGLFITSCNNDEYEEIKGDEAIPTAQALRSLFDGQTAALTNTMTFDASTNLNWVSPKGVRLIINGSCLRKNGSPVSGQVKVIYTEIFDKGNMLTSNKATMGRRDGNKELLYSGGEFYIQALQDGVELTLSCPISLDVPTSLTGGTQPGMLPFTGTINEDGELTWEQATTIELVTNAQAATPVYSALIPSFGWFNCDKFASYVGPKTTITANVPAGYGANAGIFLAVKTFPNALGKSYGLFPVGLDCHLIFVTEKDGKFRYAIKSGALTPNHTVTFSLAETTIATPAQLTAVINALP